jgi:hypothetical protein
MRGIRARTSLVLLAATVAVGLAGCSDDPRKPGTSGSSPSASSSVSAGTGSESASPGTSSGTPGAVPPAEGGGTATGSDIEVCAAQERLVAESTRKFGEEVVKAATSEGGEQAAVAAVKTLFAEWAAGMRAQAAKATNPELKSALTEYAVGLEKVNSQINGVADLDKLGDLNTAEIEAATDKVLRICG